MKRKIITSLAALSILFALTGNANADIIKITANSDSYGELGWFAVDDDIFSVDISLAASQFYDYWWSDPMSGVTITPANVPADTGSTYFYQTGNEWTVEGGDGYSLTAAAKDTALWIADDHNLGFLNFGSYFDVSWITTDYIVPVPEPATILLLGCGLLSFAGYRRNFKK